MAFIGVLAEKGTKEYSNLEAKLAFLKSQGIELEPNEKVVFNFNMEYHKDTVKNKDDKEVTRIHKAASYTYTDLKAFEGYSKDSGAILSQLMTYFEDEINITGFVDSTVYIIPCILTELNGTLTLRCLVD